MALTESKQLFAPVCQARVTSTFGHDDADTWHDLRGSFSGTFRDGVSPSRAHAARVLLAHGDEVRRGGLAWELGTQGCIVSEVEDGLELLDYLDEHGPWLPLPHPDVIVTELDMPGCGGLEAARSLRRGGIDVPILFINVGRSPATACAAARLPGCWLVEGDVEGGVLRAAVDEVLRSRVV